MNKRIEELAKEAGFCFWTNESWKPEGATIDWSCNYDDQLQRFAELVMKDCITRLNPNSDVWGLLKDFGWVGRYLENKQ